MSVIDIGSNLVTGVGESDKTVTVYLNKTVFTQLFMATLILGFV